MWHSSANKEVKNKTWRKLSHASHLKLYKILTVTKTAPVLAIIIRHSGVLKVTKMISHVALTPKFRIS